MNSIHFITSLPFQKDLYKNIISDKNDTLNLVSKVSAYWNLLSMFLSLSFVKQQDMLKLKILNVKYWGFIYTQSDLQFE